MRIIKKIPQNKLSVSDIYYRVKGKGTCLFERKSSNRAYTLIAINPVQHLYFKDGDFHVDGKIIPTKDPLKELEKQVLINENDQFTDLPFMGGAIGYVGYDVAACYEDIGDAPYDELELPDLEFYSYNLFIILENQAITLVATDSYSDETESELRIKLEELEQKLNQEQTIPKIELAKLNFSSNFSQIDFEQIVQKAQEKIIAGDLFQVVPSQRLTADFTMDSFSYYRKLKESNPSSYLYHLEFPTATIIGSSPESLVTVEGRTVTTNPIAGARKRGQDFLEDESLAAELLNDPKEIAEHRMLVDLGRNDLGKVAIRGSITVPTYLTIERYRYVMHLVSVVTGTLQPDLRSMDALKATLPAGTVSGAPKIRAMSRIYQWEPVKRSIYAGAVGFLSQDDSADFAIAIRTMVVKNKKAYVQAGAGIVYDSNPTSEYFETLQKAKTLMEVGK
ncbi:chorismate-binding protein [Enterococcus hermanniensis]|uniref:Anthranilate synthase component 1 n=1 Tax=Enterococcus hermanniensis TaxID=249189 RepID=A0A1L8TPE7_9ENTE|nr:chorismate-binding protein [Enterococcus hermanniensis]OJG46150.1 anthranilate synthase component I [Enterococcus hermanniensis]